MQHLFTYGSLQRPDIQEKLFNRRMFGRIDTLEGYEKGVLEVDDKRFNIATPKEGSLIDGIVFELTDDELERADRYEGNQYTRVRVELMSGIEAWLYIRA